MTGILFPLVLSNALRGFYKLLNARGGKRVHVRPREFSFLTLKHGMQIRKLYFSYVAGKPLKSTAKFLVVCTVFISHPSSNVALEVNFLS